MSRIFITYRREDTSSQAGRIYDWLEEQYGDGVFKDIESIDPGRPWRAAIEDAVRSADVVLALIGPRWLEELRERDGSDDYVRYELETALRQDRRVIPLLVNGAAMPPAGQLPEGLRGLGERQAFDVSDARFRSDVEELIRRLDRVVERPPRTDGVPPGNGAAPAAAATEAELDAELGKWNWGAFLLTFVWGIAHGVFRSVLVLVPIYGFYEWYLLGRNGNRWAWERRRWESVERFRQSQRGWAKAGIVVVVVLFLLVLGSTESGTA